MNTLFHFSINVDNDIKFPLSYFLACRLVSPQPQGNSDRSTCCLGGMRDKQELLFYVTWFLHEGIWCTFSPDWLGYQY